MNPNIPVSNEPRNNHGITVMHAFHSAIPELWAEAETYDSALLLLADRLALSIEYATDDFHREPIRRAIDDVSRLISATRKGPTPSVHVQEAVVGSTSTTL